MALSEVSLGLTFFKMQELETPVLGSPHQNKINSFNIIFR